MGNTPSARRLARRPGPSRTLRPPSSSRPAIILVLSAAAVVVLAVGGAIAYFLPPWLFDREVRQAAYARYVNVADAGRVREIVDANHAEIFARSFPEKTRRTEKTFGSSVYNHLMDAKVRSSLVAAAVERSAVPTATPEAAERPASNASSGSLSILALSAARVAHPEGLSLPGAPLRILVDTKGLPDDAFVRKPDSISITVACPGGEAVSLAPVSEGQPEKMGAARRFAFRVTLPASAMGSGKGVCTMATAVRDADGQVARLEQFIAIR